MISREIQTAVSLDDNGMFDRQCPKPECSRFFKADHQFSGQWNSTERYCPYCHYADADTDFQTPEQASFVQSEGMEVAKDELEDLLINSFRGNSLVKLTVKKDRAERPIPPPARPIAEFEFVCQRCGGRTGINGVGSFCHFCGQSQAAHTATRQLSLIAGKLRSLSSQDSSADQVRADEIASAFKSIVEILENVGKELYPKLSKAKGSYKRGIFQRFAQANDLWIEAGGSDLNDLFSAQDHNNFKVYAATRHVYVHNNGVIDDDYLRTSGDNRYRLGDRVVPTIADALEFGRLARIRVLQMIADAGAAPADRLEEQLPQAGVPKLTGFTDSQWKVFEAACVAAEKAQSPLLHRESVLSELPDHEIEHVRDALHLLEGYGFVSLNGTLEQHPVPRHIQVTLRGLDHYLSHTVPGFGSVQVRIAEALLAGQTSAHAISDNTGVERLVVDHVLRSFEAKGWIPRILWSGGDGIVHVVKRAFLKQFVDAE